MVLKLLRYALIMAVSLLPTGHTLASEWDDASKVVLVATKSTLEVLQQVRDQEPSVAKDRIADVLAPVVDYEAIAKGVMAKFYRRADAGQKQAFQEVFQTSLENTYANAVLTFDVKDFALQPSPGDDGREAREKIWVKVYADSSVYDIHYTMSAKTGAWKVTNVVLDGVNIGLAFRNQFAAAMREHRNDFDVVIANWVSEPQ